MAGPRVRVYDGPPKIALGELTAWRAWTINFRTVSLTSFTNNFEWGVGPVKAFNDYRYNAEKNFPKYILESNSWGFYSLKSHFNVIDYFARVKSFLCLGKINIWGQVLEGEKGYRSEYAEIVDLIAIFSRQKKCGKVIYSTDYEFLIQLKEKYQIHTVPVPTIEIPSLEFYETAEKTTKYKRWS